MAAPTVAAPSPSALSRGELTAIAHRVWTEVREIVTQRLEVLEEAVATLLEGKLSEELRQQTEVAAHRLAGSLGCFGFEEASRIARQVELTFMAPGPTPAQGLALSEMIIGLQKELAHDARPSVAASTAATPLHLPELLIIDRDPGEAERIGEAARIAGWRAEFTTDLAEAQQRIEQQPPSVILLDLGVSGLLADGVRFLAGLTAKELSIPVLVVTEKTDIINRIDVARLGGRGFFQKPLLPIEVVHWIDQIANGRAEHAEVLIMGASDGVFGELTRILQPAGIEVRRMDHLEELTATQRQGRSDAVILDFDGPAGEVLAACRRMRGDRRIAQVRILVLTEHQDRSAHESIFAAGATDVLSRPLLEPEVVARLVRPIEQARALRRLIDTDPITEMPNRTTVEAAITRYLHLAERHGTPYTLALIDIDNFRQINLHYGIEAGHMVLQKVGDLLETSFRHEDVIGRWGDDEFAVGTYELTSRDVMDRMSQIMLMVREQNFRAPGGHDFRITFSCGLAEYPQDGKDLQTLYAAADRALQRARGQGRDRAAAAGLALQRNQTIDLVDVALIEDDEAVGSLLMQSLHLKGHRTAWFKNGRLAVDALSGPQATVDARVILLDVDLPGLDGLSVLQRLARYGIQRKSRVIMLTVRSGEAEVLTALKLGAFDHVAKPFSMPVLMERIRHAMEI